jgi:4-hydroxy-tetrahydrodipicolinate synthase
MFEGIFTAIVTPFKNGVIDQKAYERLVEEQIKAGVHGIVPCGTTGESPTLSKDEKKTLISLTVKIVKGRVQVIAGTGSNCTRTSVEMTSWAKKAGADGALAVVPYYNKPTQKGLYLHYKEVASVGIPIVVYNVPSRTITSITPETLGRLSSELRDIVAIKEATGDMELDKKFLELTKGKVDLLSGDDGTFFDFMKIGGKGCISVVSNVVPKEMIEIYNLCMKKDVDKAGALNKKLEPLIKALFIESNPIPVKHALHLMGKIGAELRLPLSSMEENNLAKLKTVLKDMGLI